MITSKIENKINQIINKSLYDYDDLIKLYYLRNLLSENQKQNIIDKLIKEDFSNLKINNNFVLLLSYNFNNPELTNKIKKYILNSDFVFNTGISFDANGKMSRHNIIYFKIIDYINTNWKKIDVITWENEDIKIFYNKLKISLNLLKNNIDKNDPFTFINTRIVLEDMYLFLKNQESILKDELDYFEILTSVEKEFFEFCGYKDLKEALLSKDDTIQMLALNNFFIELRNNPTKELKEEWMLLIFKVLKQEEPRFEVALEYLAYLLFLWLKDQVWPKQYSNFYLMILKKNKENPIDEGDRIHNETCLVKIALALKNNWNINDPIIDEWLEYKKQSEFIDINEIDDVTKDKI